jgi:hypothetical protein
MKRTTVALVVSVALLSLGLGGCHIQGGGPCCWQGSAQLMIGDVGPCCEPGAPPAVQSAPGGTAAKDPFSAGAPAADATARFDLVRLEARTVLARSAARLRPLYMLDCALRL